MFNKDWYKKRQVAVADMVEAINVFTGNDHGLQSVIKEVKRDLNSYNGDGFVKDVVVAGGAPSNIMLGIPAVNDVDIYFVVDSSRSGWPTNYLATHTTGKWIKRFEDVDYDGVSYWNDQINDKVYKVRRCSRRGIYNIIEVVCLFNKIPTVKDFVRSFDLDVCQSGFRLDDKYVTMSDDYEFIHDISVNGCFTGMDAHVEITNWHTPIQSLFRALTKADSLGLAFRLNDSLMEKVYKWWVYRDAIRPSVFNLKKYVEAYHIYSDRLSPYFLIARDDRTGCWKPVWNEDFVKGIYSKAFDTYVEYTVFDHFSRSRGKSDCSVEQIHYLDGRVEIV